KRSFLCFLRGMSLLELRFNQWRQCRSTLVGQLEAIHCHREDVRRRRIEVEQKAEGLRQIDVGKIPQHCLTVHAAVEKTGQNGALQQRSPPIRIESEHGARQLREQNARKPAVKGTDQHDDIAVAMLQRRCTCESSEASSSISLVSIDASSAGSLMSTV